MLKRHRPFLHNSMTNFNSTSSHAFPSICIYNTVAIGLCNETTKTVRQYISADRGNENNKYQADYASNIEADCYLVLDAPL